MSWRTFTVADIKAKLSPTEFATLLSQMGEAEMQNSINQMVDKVRGYVAANSENQLGEAGTLPSRLIGSTVDALIPALYGFSGGVLIDLSDVRKTAAENAERLFKDVARGDFKVEDPTVKSNEDRKSSAVEYIDRSPGRRPLEHDDLRGL